MLWLFVRPSRVYLLDFFCSSIQFYLLSSPYLCIISLLYLDLYVLGEKLKVMLAGLQIRVRIGNLFSLFLIRNICCGYSKEPSQ